MEKILIVIADIELKYFEFNDLVTNFWFLKEFIERGYDVKFTVKNKLFIKSNTAMANIYECKLKDNNIFIGKEIKNYSLNNFDYIFFRPDPPVDIDYINACYVLDFVDTKKVTLINNTKSILDFGEKFHINYFPKYVAKNIITASQEIIREFTDKYGQAVIKPLNECFGAGIFKLDKNDVNANSIIKSVTNDGRTMACVEEFLGNNQGGDKRAFIVGEKVYPYSLRKLAGERDFKFNTHSDKFFEKSMLTEKEMELAKEVAKFTNKKGLYLCAIDIIDEKITEINITCPCYFFREMNRLHGINFQDIIMQDIIELMHSIKKRTTLC